MHEPPVVVIFKIGQIFSLHAKCGAPESDGLRNKICGKFPARKNENAEKFVGEG